MIRKKLKAGIRKLKLVPRPFLPILLTNLTYFLSNMTVTRSETYYERRNAAPYGNWILEELERDTGLAETMIGYLQDLLWRDGLRRRMMFELSFRVKVRAYCMKQAATSESQRIRDLCGVILKCSAKWV